MLQNTERESGYRKILTLFLFAQQTCNEMTGRITSSGKVTLVVDPLEILSRKQVKYYMTPQKN